MHYVTIHYPTGRWHYEGYRKYEDAQTCLRAEAQVDYAGETLPFAAMEREIAFNERENAMPALQGTEAQIPWARAIRYRFWFYLVNRYSEDEAKRRYSAEEARAKGVAGYWLDNRYSLAVTNQESKYVAEGKGDIWAM